VNDRAALKSHDGSYSKLCYYLINNFMAYVYTLKNLITNQFYIGSRNKNPINDFWVKYFTSSKEVKKLIDLHGISSFSYQIIFENEDYTTCYWHEQTLIKECIKNSLCLNKRYQDPISNKPCWSNVGRTASEETRNKISLAGKNRIVKEETRKKISLALKGVSRKSILHTEETRKKISKGKIGNKSLTGRCWFNDGIKNYSLFPNDSKIGKLHLGRLKFKRKTGYKLTTNAVENIKASLSNRHWYNNGKETFYINDNDPKIKSLELRRGRSIRDGLSK
jgi:hypothetical protein